MAKLIGLNRRVFWQVLLLGSFLATVSIFIVFSRYSAEQIDASMLLMTIIMEVIQVIFMTALVTWAVYHRMSKPIHAADCILRDRDRTPEQLREEYQQYMHQDREFVGLLEGILQQKTDVYELRRKLFKRGEELAAQKKIAVQSAKLASLGEMAGGIAHEINNPLQVIQGQADLMILSLAGGVNESELRESIARAEASLHSIISSCRRISRITRSLLHFARSSEAGATQVDLESFVDEVLSLSDIRLRKYGIRFDVDYISRPDFIYCNDVQIGQILINLINNAIDYLLEDHIKQPWIKLTVDRCKDSLVIKLSNAGAKIHPEIASKIFEPFYTTKKRGKGTGLGLSMSLAIAKRHGGSLSLDMNSEVTTFVLSLPQLEARLQA